MEDTNVSPGLSERILREVLATPAVKDTILRSMGGIRPETAAGLARTMLWDDPAVTMSLFGALPKMVDWTMEFLLEMGRQLNAVPEPLLKGLLAEVGKGIDVGKMNELPVVYGQLARRLAGEGGMPAETRAAMIASVNSALARLDRFTLDLKQNRKALARSLSENVGEIDVAVLGRSLCRMARVGATVTMSMGKSVLRPPKKRRQG